MSKTDVAADFLHFESSKQMFKSLLVLHPSSVVFNFTLNDKRQSPVFNVIMWACLFVGQGVQVCLYCQEWYAQTRCPRSGVRTKNPQNALMTLKSLKEFK